MKQSSRIALVLALAAGVSACGTGEAEETVALQTVAVARGDMRITAEAVGTIEPVRTVEVKSKASGEILTLHVDVGAQVQAGTLLAEIDPRDVRNRYDQAQADLAVSDAQAANAETQLRRSEELHAAGIITDQELEQARLSHTNQQASLTRARTNFELASLQLEDVTIRAPMDGTILQKNVEEGTVIQSASGSVSGGTALFVMASLGEMQVRTLIDEVDIGQLRAGMPAAITVQSYEGRSFDGYVQQIEPQAVVQQNVTKFPVIIALDNNEGLLKPGMNADVEVLIDEVSGALLLDNLAIIMPDDALPAALALGLPESSLQTMGEAADGGAERTAARPESEGEGRPEGGSEGAATPDAAAGEAPATNGSTPAPDAAAQAPAGAGEGQQVRRGQGGGQGRGGQARGGRGQGVGRQGQGGQGGQGAARRTQSAVVFVLDQAGAIAPRQIQIGLSDYLNTQIVSGLEEGEQVVLVGAAQLMEQQEALSGRGGAALNPFGGNIPGQRGGGGGGRGGRGF